MTEKRKRHTVRFAPHVADALSRIADNNGVSPAAMIRIIVLDYILNGRDTEIMNPPIKKHSHQIAFMASIAYLAQSDAAQHEENTSMYFKILDSFYDAYDVPDKHRVGG